MIYKQLLEVKGRFGKMAVSATFKGESKVAPADSCSQIANETNIDINGFYWIKNKCSKDPHKI